MKRSVDYPPALLGTRCRLENLPAVAVTLRVAGAKWYVSAGCSPSQADAVEAVIRADWPRARETSGTRRWDNVDRTWRVNP